MLKKSIYSKVQFVLIKINYVIKSYTHLFLMYYKLDFCIKHICTEIKKNTCLLQFENVAFEFCY